MSLLDKVEVTEAAKMFRTALKRHGLHPYAMSEYVLAKPLQSPKSIGDHLLFLVEEIPSLVKGGDWLEANYNLAFALGGAFALGLFSIEELDRIAFREIAEEAEEDI